MGFYYRKLRQPLVQALTVLYSSTDQATRLADSTIYLSEKSTIDDKEVKKKLKLLLRSTGP